MFPRFPDATILGMRGISMCFPRARHFQTDQSDCSIVGVSFDCVVRFVNRECASELLRVAEFIQETCVQNVNKGKDAVKAP